MYTFSFIVGNITPKKCKVYPLSYYRGSVGRCGGIQVEDLQKMSFQASVGIGLGFRVEGLGLQNMGSCQNYGPLFGVP